MEKIAAYKTTDGSIFHDRKEAKEHQKAIDSMNALRALADAFQTPQLDGDRLGDWLCDNKERIAQVIKTGSFTATVFKSADPVSEPVAEEPPKPEPEPSEEVSGEQGVADDLENVLKELDQA